MPRKSLWNQAYHGQTEKVRMSLANGADIEEQGGAAECSLLSIAACKGHWDVVVLLLEKGADVSSKNKYGRTPLHNAARKGRGEVAQLLVEKGANVHAKDKAGNTPETWATKNSHVRLAAMLKAAAEASAVAKIAATLTAASETKALQELPKVLAAKDKEIGRLRLKNKQQFKVESACCQTGGDRRPPTCRRGAGVCAGETGCAAVRQEPTDRLPPPAS